MRATGGRVQGWDVLRGLAIGLVLLHHAWPGTFGNGGIVGVVVFFALSGYLITGVLMKDVQRLGRIRYRHFYRNRAIRLLPALILMLLGFLAVTRLVNPMHDQGTELRSILVALTYTADIPFNHGSPALAHLWTLAVEEQFYLVWPILLVVGMRLRRLRPLVAMAGAALYVLCAASLVLVAPEGHRVYTLPTSWAVVMVIGATARLGHERVERVLGRLPVARGPLAWAALALVVALGCTPETKDWPGLYLVVAPLVGAATVVLISHLGTWEVLPTAALRPVLALGTVSYAAYLWNYPIVKWLSPSTDPDVGTGLLSVVLTIAAATASWWLVERHAGTVKRHLDRRAQTVSASR